MSSHPSVFRYHPEQRLDQHSVSHSHYSRIPTIPDLRFENSYLRSIRPFIHVHQLASAHKEVQVRGQSDEDETFDTLDGQGYEKVKGKRRLIENQSDLFHLGSSKQALASPATSPSLGVIRVEWGIVLWVTIRDQVISPMLQGALWGVASHYITPMLRAFNTRLYMDLKSSLTPAAEGFGVGRPKSWIQNFRFSELVSSRH